MQLHRWGFTLDGIRYTHPTNVVLALNALAGAQAVGTVDSFDKAEKDIGRQSVGRRRKARSAGLGDASASANFKVKRNTADIGRVHAWVPGHGWLEFDAANAAYADGLSLYQHQKIGAWAKARNMAFSSVEDQLAARASLIARVAELAPEMPLRERRAVARMVEGGTPTDVTLIPVHAEDEGVIEADTCEDREDPMPALATMRSSLADEHGNTSRPPSAEEMKVQARLDELRGLDWQSPAAEDEVMEELA